MKKCGSSSKHQNSCNDVQHQNLQWFPKQSKQITHMYSHSFYSPCLYSDHLTAATSSSGGERTVGSPRTLWR